MLIDVRDQQARGAMFGLFGPQRSATALTANRRAVCCEEM
jgi:hypothetical protein